MKHGIVLTYLYNWGELLVLSVHNLCQIDIMLVGSANLLLLLFLITLICLISRCTDNMLVNLIYLFHSILMIYSVLQ